VKTLYRTAHVKKSNSFERELFNLQDSEHPDQPTKMKDEKLEQILDENPCQTQTWNLQVSLK